MKTVKLPSGETVPALGQGTWGMGEKPAHRSAEIAALRTGLDLGMTLIDTAEMYGDGKTEELAGEAIAGRRAEVFLVSKFYPHHATRKLVAEACHRSLARLKTDFLDLYLLHWRGSTPLAETFDGLARLREAGKIRHFGVSNFDTDDMEEAVAAPHGDAIATDQVLYNLSRRGAEWDLLPWCRAHEIPAMAYSPVEQGRLLKRRELQAIAARHHATPAQVALAWVLREPQVIAIPKAATIEYVRENHGALALELTADDWEDLDTHFPPPKKKHKLEML